MSVYKFTQLQLDTEQARVAINTAFGEAMHDNGLTLVDATGVPQNSYLALDKALVANLASASCAAKSERYDNAVRETKLTALAFAKTPSPDVFQDWEDRDERYLAGAVWERARGAVVAQLKTERVLRMVNDTYGEELCRAWLSTREHPEPSWAYYTTVDLGCLKQDGVGPLYEGVRRAEKKMVKKVGAIIGRHPEHGNALIRDINKVLRGQLDGTVQELKLALQKANGNGAPPDETDQEAVA